jgi:hypothetical protein
VLGVALALWVVYVARQVLTWVLVSAFLALRSTPPSSGCSAAGVSGGARPPPRSSTSARSPRWLGSLS